jgi:hypothetical protein
VSLNGWPQFLAYAFVTWFVVRPIGIHLARLAEQRAEISAAQKAQLTAAFEALGPERVGRGLGAKGHGWRDCFLALASYYGPAARWHKLTKYGWMSQVHLFSSAIGTSPDVIRGVVKAWDRNEAAFRKLAGRWLEHGSEPAVPTAPELVTEEWGA